MTDDTPLLTREEFKSKPADFRIGAIIADGMWYTVTKWRKMSMVTEEQLQQWIDTKLEEGILLQASSGARSYRSPLQSIIDWYSEQRLDPTKRLLPGVFPPRIWDRMTETEGFLDAPLREVGIVKITSGSTRAIKAITERLRGVGRVKAEHSGEYKVYGLDAIYIKSLVMEVLEEFPENEVEKVDSRVKSMRRELADFTKGFSGNLVQFYTTFGKLLVKSQMDTIQIFLPDPEDQHSQITLWVIEAIKKFDETAAVPFSGYLDNVLKRWPYDLPNIYLGKELSTFQRAHSRAVKRLREAHGENTTKVFSNQEIADEMGVSLEEFLDLDEKHKTWINSKNATTLTWADTAEEKMSRPPAEEALVAETDHALAHRLSRAAVQAALETGDYDSAMTLISQMDIEDTNMSKLRDLGREFVVTLGVALKEIETEDEGTL